MITPLPTPPSRSDPPDTFVTRADALLGALPTLVTEMNVDVGTVNALATALPAKAGYSFSATTTSGTTSGQVRFNSATVASITTVWVNETSSVGDATGFCDLFNMTTSTSAKGILKVSEQATPGDYIYFKVTGHSDSGTERALTVVPLNASATPSHAISAVSVWVEFWPLGDAGSLAGGVTLSNANVTGIKQATWNGEIANAATSGAITIDWTAGHRQTQAEPTGTITYTFTAPTGSKPADLLLRVISDGSSAAQTFNWPATVKWVGVPWTPVANKNALVAFYFDGTNYWAQGANEA
jgi:hypothetical protein